MWEHTGATYHIRLNRPYVAFLSDYFDYLLDVLIILVGMYRILNFTIRLEPDSTR